MVINKTYFKVILSALLLSIHFSSSAVPNYYRVNNEPGLYFPDDDVNIITNDNFNSSIFLSKTAWLVEFYSNWCGYCQSSVSKYQAFATDTKGWDDLVKIGAIDCANEDNEPICQLFGIITDFPKFMYFHEGFVANPGETGMLLVSDSHTDYADHRKMLVDIMRKEQMEGRGKIFPNLQPFTDLNMRTFVDNNQLGFLIIQEPSDDVGLSITLDFHKVKEVVIRYTYNSNTSIKTDLYPALFEVDKNHNLVPIKVVFLEDARESLKIALRDILSSRKISLPIEIFKNTKEIEHRSFSVSRDELDLRRKIRDMGDVVYQIDLENALRYSLKREVGVNVKIQGEKLEALRNYIHVLVKYFPFGPKGKNLLEQINQYVISNSIVNGTYIARLIKESDKESLNIFSGPPQWLGCRGSRPTKRGFPCGVWKLFHFLTVNAAFDTNNTKDSNPKIVLEAMHGYIKYFFGCEICTRHFQEMAARRKIFNVSSWDESVLWLWRAHNEVNKRVAGDDSEDPEFPKVQFPTKDKCFQCWKTNDANDETEVLSYLKQMYDKENIKYMGVTGSTGSSVLVSNLVLVFCGLMILGIFL